MREAKLKRIRDAYFGPLTLREVARANAVGDSWLERFWRDERKAGRIDDVPRPHFAKFCKPAPAPVEVIEPAADEADDEAPIGDFNPRHERECAASLASLREHHADIAERPAAHCAPASWLAWDHKRPAASPSHAELMAMCRAYDQGARAC